MSSGVRIVAMGRERRLADAELPIIIGSHPASAIRIPGPVAAPPAAQVGLLDGRPFLQPGTSNLTVNGEAVSGTRWLQDDDVIAIAGVEIQCREESAGWLFTVTSDGGGYQTVPPDLPAADELQGETIAPVARRGRTGPEPAPTPASPRERRGRTWFFAALALLLACLSYLLLARAVRIEVDPVAADITLAGGIIRPEFGGRYLLLPGEYRVLLKADGYQQAREEITVTKASSQSFTFVLQKLPGRLVVLTDRDVAARVFVDDEERGTTPTGELELPAGPHALRIEADRFLPFETTVEVTGLGMRQEYSARLQPGWADVTVTSVPAGANILLGDEILGTTPATVPMMAGSRELQLQLDGYKLWRQLLTVSAGQQLELPEVPLQSSDGVLAVTSSPAGAAVSIDGRYRGATPVEAELPPGNSYEVIVSKPGFSTETRRVTMSSRQGQSLRVTLAPRLGEVTINAEPRDAELFIDGKSHGKAGQLLTLPARAHRIELRKPGYATHVAEVTPKPGLPQVLDIQLLTESQAVLARTPQTILTGQKQELLLIDGGEFDMGAPRREQGRRPNESERKVSLVRRFYIARREVTNTEFRAFRAQHTSGAEKFRELGVGDHPAVLLGWEEAAAYCNWLSDMDGLPRAYVVAGGGFELASPVNTGYRLPTEAEWSWVARQNGGGGERRYPWGDSMPPAPNSGNFADRSAQSVVANILSSYNDGYPVTAPVGKFTASPLGLFDLGGNAAEWVNDRYTVYPPSPVRAIDPVGPGEGQYHVIRGSGWRHASISELRFAYRDFGDQGRLDVGFRIARYAEEEN